MRLLQSSKSLWIRMLAQSQICFGDGKLNFHRWSVVIPYVKLLLEFGIQYCLAVFFPPLQISSLVSLYLFSISFLVVTWDSVYMPT